LELIIWEKLSEASPVDSLHSYELEPKGDGDDIDDCRTPEYSPIDPESQMPEADEWDAEAFDQYIASKVRLPKDGQEVLGQVIARKRDHNGNPIGKANANPILDTRLYQVMFPDGATSEYSANVIVECLYSQVYSEGNRYLLLDSIMDWKKTSDAVDDSDVLQISFNGNLHPRCMVKGWKLCVKWKDGSTSWESLKDLKEFYPVQVAEFAAHHKLDDKPAFRWWVKDTLKQRDCIIKADKTCYIKCTHKYGIQLPKSVEEAYELDRLYKKKI
jgi:hypothetical protein